MYYQAHKEGHCNFYCYLCPQLNKQSHQWEIITLLHWRWGVWAGRLSQRSAHPCPLWLWQTPSRLSPEQHSWPPPHMEPAKQDTLNHNFTELFTPTCSCCTWFLWHRDKNTSVWHTVEKRAFHWIMKELQRESWSNLNVWHSHQGQQLLALIIMLLGDFYQTLGEFVNILLFPWDERKHFLQTLIQRK